MTRYNFRDARDFLKEVPADELYDDVCGAMLMLDRITGKRNNVIANRVFDVLLQCADLLDAMLPDSDINGINCRS